MQSALLSSQKGQSEHRGKGKVNSWKKKKGVSEGTSQLKDNRVAIKCFFYQKKGNRKHDRIKYKWLEKVGKLSFVAH